MSDTVSSCTHLDEIADVAPNFHSAGHPIIQSFEPGEDWWFCYIDDLVFRLAGASSFAHS